MADTYEKRAREKRKEQKRREKAEAKRRLKEAGGDQADESEIAARYLDIPDEDEA